MEIEIGENLKRAIVYCTVAVVGTAMAMFPLWLGLAVYFSMPTSCP